MSFAKCEGRISTKAIKSLMAVVVAMASASRCWTPSKGSAFTAQLGVRRGPMSVVPVCKVSVGDPMPSFSLRDQDGGLVSLSDFKHKPVVLFFYPADNTPGCTREACAFRDAFTEFNRAGAEVIGISGDGPKTHKAFAEKHGLPFTLLCDAKDRLRKELEIPGEFFGVLPGRQTYVIDRKGIVRLVFNDQYASELHVAEALKVVRSMVRRGFGGSSK